MNELITMNPINTIPDRKPFTDQRLEKATTQIFQIYAKATTYADTQNRKIAEILSTVKTQKSYEKDGFKSVSDYAEKTFNIKRQNAYALATAGDIYNDDSASDELKAFSPSKLAELARGDREMVEEAVKAGTITPQTTQKVLRDFVKTGDEESVKPEIVTEYKIRPLVAGMNEELSKALTDHKTIEEWDAWLSSYVKSNWISIREVEVIKLPKSSTWRQPNAEKKTVQRRLYITEAASLAVEFYTYTPEANEKKEQAKTIEFTIEELQAMLAAKIAEATEATETTEATEDAIDG